jgi:hypothetical protein
MSTLLSLSKQLHGRVVNEPLDRAAREREFDAVTEPRRVNLSPENRFEASPLAGIPLPPALSGVTLVCLCALSTLVVQRKRKLKRGPPGAPSSRGSATPSLAGCSAMLI